MSITVAGERWVKARKVHRCSLCLEDTIQPGDRYHRSAMIDSGISVFTWEMDVVCEALWSAWWPLFGESEEAVSEGSALDLVDDFREGEGFTDDLPAICRERWGGER